MLNIPRYERNDMLDAFLYGHVKMISSKFFPKHATRKYTVKFDVHPFIKWLSKFLPITPYIEADYPDDADPLYMRANNTLVMGERTFDALKRSTDN